MIQQTTCLEYKTVVTDAGEWKHAPSTDYVFAFIKSEWDDKDKLAVGKAFQDALGMSSKIKDAVKAVSGQDVVNGLYALDHEAMVEAMNSIEGMGQTEVNNEERQGKGTAVTINKEFFGAVLAGLGGDLAPLTVYLTESMGDVQAQTKKTGVTKNFGTVIGLVSLMPDLNTPVTTFKYAYSSEETSKWFVKVNCGSTEHYSYDYKYTTVTYNYDKPSK